MQTRSKNQPVVPAWVLSLMALAAVAVLIGAATPPGAAAAGAVQRFLGFYAGVFTLLAMSTAVVSGLVATDRMVLKIGHRVFIQGVHRSASLITCTMVVAHIMVNVLDGLVRPQQIVVPSSNAVGAGTVAFELILVVLVLGLLRARFAEARWPKAWRVMHGLAYVGWPLAIAHGLTAGRPAANWVVLSYLMCAGAVFIAAIARVMVTIRPGGADPRRTPETAPAPIVQIQLTESQVADLQAARAQAQPQAAQAQVPVRQRGRAPQGPGVMR